MKNIKKVIQSLEEVKNSSQLDEAYKNKIQVAIDELQTASKSGELLDRSAIIKIILKVVELLIDNHYLKELIDKWTLDG